MFCGTVEVYYDLYSFSNLYVTLSIVLKCHPVSLLDTSLSNEHSVQQKHLLSRTENDSTIAQHLILSICNISSVSVYTSLVLTNFDVLIQLKVSPIFNSVTPMESIYFDLLTF